MLESEISTTRPSLTIRSIKVKKKTKEKGFKIRTLSSMQIMTFQCENILHGSTNGSSLH